MTNRAPPHNLRFDSTTSHPIIDRVQNYQLDRKLLSVHSTDRDLESWPFAFEFQFKTPQPYYNVQTLRLSDISLPETRYNFSILLQNSKFRIRLLDGPGRIYTNITEQEKKTFSDPSNYLGIYDIILPDGFYDPCILLNSLNNILNNTVTNAIGASYSEFVVIYNPAAFQFSFGNKKDSFLLLFDYEYSYSLDDIVPIQYKDSCDSDPPDIGRCREAEKFKTAACKKFTRGRIKTYFPPAFNNTTYWGFPYYLGYEKKPYRSQAPLENITKYWADNSILISSGDPTATPPISPGQYVYPVGRASLVSADRTIYMELGKWNSIDELAPFPKRENDTYNRDQNFRVDAAFAKLPSIIAPPGVAFFAAGGFQRNITWMVPPAERIENFFVRFRYHDGMPVDFGNIEFTFTLEIGCLRNQFAVQDNVAIPAVANWNP